MALATTILQLWFLCLDLISCQVERGLGLGEVNGTAIFQVRVRFDGESENRTGVAFRPVRKLWAFWWWGLSPHLNTAFKLVGLFSPWPPGVELSPVLGGLPGELRRGATRHVNTRRLPWILFY